MVSKREFNRIEKENPKSRIWKRTWNYQKARNELANALIKRNEKKEKAKRINYLFEKTFSNEELNDEDKKFLISLPKDDLEKFAKKVNKIVKRYYEMIGDDFYFFEREPQDSDVKMYIKWNKILDYIQDNRSDIEIGRYIHTWRIHIEYSADVETPKGIQNIVFDNRVNEWVRPILLQWVVAQCNDNWEGVRLSQITDITKEEAKALSKAKWIFLDSLTTITDETAECLSQVKEYLSLMWLMSITDEQAKLLAKCKRLAINKEILTQKQEQILKNITYLQNEE